MTRLLGSVSLKTLLFRLPVPRIAKPRDKDASKICSNAGMTSTQLSRNSPHVSVTGTRVDSNRRCRINLGDMNLMPPVSSFVFVLMRLWDWYLILRPRKYKCSFIVDSGNGQPDHSKWPCTGGLRSYWTLFYQYFVPFRNDGKKYPNPWVIALNGPVILRVVDQWCRVAHNEVKIDKVCGQDKQCEIR